MLLRRERVGVYVSDRDYCVQHSSRFLTLDADVRMKQGQFQAHVDRVPTIRFEPSGRVPYGHALII